MSFYTYSQNNTGGSWVADAALSKVVFIEANSAEQADERAQAIGIYFDGCHSGIDCSCCGDRWYRAWGDPDSTPNYYGQEVAPGTPWADVNNDPWARRWIKDKPEGYIHYLDGRIEPTLI